MLLPEGSTLGEVLQLWENPRLLWSGVKGVADDLARRRVSVAALALRFDRLPAVEKRKLVTLWQFRQNRLLPLDFRQQLRGFGLLPPDPLSPVPWSARAACQVTGQKKLAKSCLGAETFYTGQVLHIRGRDARSIIGNPVDRNSAKGPRGRPAAPVCKAPSAL